MMLTNLCHFGWDASAREESVRCLTLTKRNKRSQFNTATKIYSFPNDSCLTLQCWKYLQPISAKIRALQKKTL